CRAGRAISSIWGSRAVADAGPHRARARRGGRPAERTDRRSEGSFWEDEGSSLPRSPLREHFLPRLLQGYPARADVPMHPHPVPVPAAGAGAQPMPFCRPTDPLESRTRDTARFRRPDLATPCGWVRVEAVLAGPPQPPALDREIRLGRTPPTGGQGPG